MKSNQPRPDLTSTLVVLLLSAALTIFTFWIASRLSGSSAFEDLPSFITETYKALWSTVIAGTTGIGLALFKAFTERNRIQPDYLKLVGITTACLLLVVAIVVGASRLVSEPNVVGKIPDGVSRIAETGSSKGEFDLVDPSNSVKYLSYSLRGKFRADGGRLEGHLEEGTISVFAEIPRFFPQKVTSISFRACFLERVNGVDRMNVFPETARSRDSVDVDLVLQPGAKLKIAPASFSFPLPEKSRLSRAWLCAAIKTDINSYFPAQ